MTDSEDRLHSDVDAWLENVPNGRCPGAWVSERFAELKSEWQAEAWDEGLDAGQDRWMDSREFGDAPVNPYRAKGRNVDSV